MALIEKEPLLRRLRARYSRVEGGGTIYTPSMMLAIRIVEQAPTIDAAPVVHCRECRRGQEDDAGIMHCHKFHIHKKPDGFCSDGEPREAAT